MKVKYNGAWYKIQAIHSISGTDNFFVHSEKKEFSIIPCDKIEDIDNGWESPLTGTAGAVVNTPMTDNQYLVSAIQVYGEEASVVFDFQNQKYLSGQPGLLDIQWVENIQEAIIMNEPDNVKMIMTILEQTVGKSFITAKTLKEIQEAHS